jgi:alkylresorcinol/alkylpyrone synthase
VTNAHLASLATAVPPHVLHQDKVTDAAAELFAGPKGGHAAERLRPIFANAQIERRHSCVPLEWYLSPHTFRERNDLYLENALALLQQAATRALVDAGLAASDIDMIVTVSSSGIATPSLDAQLMERMPFRRDVARLPVFGLGCAGGVLGLARAATLARGQPGAKILLLVVELCGLTFRYRDRSKSNIVAAALFGDGAAAAVVSADAAGPVIADWAEHTWPNSLDIMGWDVGDDGLTVNFSRDIPQLVRSAFDETLGSFLRQRDLALADFDAFVPHPGGAKVIDALEEVFHLPDGGLVDARATLRDYGNMSAVTVLFVLQRLMQTKPDFHRALLTALGPGFTGALLVLEQR